tara:strand:- start:618 stop:854 length:237 start_codon:yes stop_codon:yes gene_type:complete
MSIIHNFINGLKKSFSGKQYTREIFTCKACGSPVYVDSICSYCRTCIDYDLAKYQPGRANTKPFSESDWWRHGEKGAT